MKLKTTEPLLDKRLIAFEVWLNSPVGQKIFALQQLIVDGYLQTLFGYHLLHLSAAREINLAYSSQIKHQCILNVLKGNNTDLLFDNDQLPIATESVDVVILHHLLGLCDNPHLLLKEVSRVLIPSGHVIIIGFNPYSFLGGVQLALKLIRKQSLEHLFSTVRLLDWMKLVDFSLQKINYNFFRPPFKFCLDSSICASLDNQLQKKNWPVGAFYVLQAQKVVKPFTTIKKKTPLFSQGIIKPVIKPSIPASKVNKNNS